MENKINSEASAHLDLIRAITAIAVAVGHIRSLFFVNYDALESHTFFAQLFYFFTGLGHQGVIVFFVLSGLLVGGSALKAIAARTWSWKAYAIARLSRLYVVLIPGLLLTWIFDTVGMAITNNRFIYAGSAVFGNVIDFSITSTHTVGNFLGTLFFLQNIIVKSFGSNAPLWSLANEFWYYAVFPLILFAVLKLTKRETRLIGLFFALSAAAILLFVGWNISSLFPVWIFGVIAFSRAISKAVVPPWLNSFLKIVAFLGVVWAFFAIRFSLIKDPIFADIVLGLAVAFGLWSILSFSKNALSERYKKISKIFASFSYDSLCRAFAVYSFNPWHHRGAYGTFCCRSLATGSDSSWHRVGNICNCFVFRVRHRQINRGTHSLGA